MSSVSFSAAGDSWMLGQRRFGSRLLVGTGKYRDLAETGAAIAASSAEIVTVAIRRSNIGQDPSQRGPPRHIRYRLPAKITMPTCRLHAAP